MVQDPPPADLKRKTVTGEMLQKDDIVQWQPTRLRKAGWSQDGPKGARWAGLDANAALHL